MKQNQKHTYSILTESSGISDVKALHNEAMKQLREAIPKDIRITFTNGDSCVVRCTVRNAKETAINNNEYIGKQYKMFNVLVDDLKDLGAPVRGFQMVEYNRKKYQVVSDELSGFENVIRLGCVMNG